MARHANRITLHDAQSCRCALRIIRSAPPTHVYVDAYLNMGAWLLDKTRIECSMATSRGSSSVKSTVPVRGFKLTLKYFV